MKMIDNWIITGIVLATIDVAVALFVAIRCMKGGK